MKAIPGFPNYYVDKEGNVYSGKYSNIRKLKTYGKYLQVSLRKDGKYHHRYNHRLVLETFKGPCPKGMESRHLDGVKNNNKLSNLRWDTPSSNNLDKRKHGTVPNQKGEKNPKAILTELDVIEIKRLLEAGEITQTELGKMYNVGGFTISSINIGRIWRHIK